MYTSLYIIVILTTYPLNRYQYHSFFLLPRSRSIRHLPPPFIITIIIVYFTSCRVGCHTAKFPRSSPPLFGVRRACSFLLTLIKYYNYNRVGSIGDESSLSPSRLFIQNIPRNKFNRVNLFVSYTYLHKQLHAVLLNVHMYTYSAYVQPLAKLFQRSFVRCMFGYKKLSYKFY